VVFSLDQVGVLLIDGSTVAVPYAYGSVFAHESESKIVALVVGADQQFHDPLVFQGALADSLDAESAVVASLRALQGHGVVVSGELHSRFLSGFWFALHTHYTNIEKTYVKEILENFPLLNYLDLVSFDSHFDYFHPDPFEFLSFLVSLDYGAGARGVLIGSGHPVCLWFNPAIPAIFFFVWCADRVYGLCVRLARFVFQMSVELGVLFWCLWRGLSGLCRPVLIGSTPNPYIEIPRAGRCAVDELAVFVPTSFRGFLQDRRNAG
jgi:hypothetical protein